LSRLPGLAVRDEGDLAGLPLDKPLAFTDLLAERVAKGLAPYKPLRLIMPDIFTQSPEAMAAAGISCSE
jgi:hypothetical protein